MGREIRMVPANWEHPIRDPRNDLYGHGGYQPMYDETFAEVFAKWLDDFDRIRSGALEPIEVQCYPNGLADWLNDEGVPPNPAYYRPYTDDEAAWFQVWETVSEGTPVTPPFETRAELADYLATRGDFWDQKRGDPPWNRQAAEKFVSAGWAPSMMVSAGVVYTAATGFPDGPTAQDETVPTPLG
jgi:hypothetical protein